MPGISDLLDSDLEDMPQHIDENSIISSASEAVGDMKAPAPKAKRKRKGVTMPKPKSKVAKTSQQSVSKRATQTGTSAKRKALENHVRESSIAESQIEDQHENDVQEAERVSKSRVAGNRTKTVQQPVMREVEEQEGMEVEQTPMMVTSNHAANKTKTTVPKVVKANRIPVKRKPTQVVESMTQAENMELDNDADELEAVALPALAQNNRIRTNSQTRHEPPYKRRAGSVSDTERGDPNLRRRLGDITRKFENIDMKYRQLKEVGIVEAASSVEKLRKQCEATTEASQNLVTSLKKELALSGPLAGESRKLKQQVQGQENEITALKQSNLDLNTALSLAQNEIKTLQAKLAAARKASVEPVNTVSKTPGSAIKHNTALTRTNIINGQRDSESAHLAQMKLDLYSDLTGLIVRSVKRSEDGDTYDCIQTGRNGTLHFKLFIDTEDANGKSGVSFEETEFLYTPLLDASRDKEMVELMPVYLTEEITFARQNAAKFYQRVVDTLTRRVAE